MKGVIFTEFANMVETTMSPDMMDDLIEATSPASGGAYTSVGNYPHEELTSMVVELSRRTGVPVPELLQSFGAFLFGQFRILYPSFFTEDQTFADFIAGVDDVIHREVMKLYPDASPPDIEVIRRDPSSMTVRYRSSRGFQDVAVGLINGCAESFGEQVQVTVTDQGGGSSLLEITGVRE